MKRSRSVVPASAQIPVAVVLGAVFLVLLYTRFGPSADKAPAAAPSALPTTSTSLQADLAANLETLKALPPVQPPSTEPPPIPRNPFFPLAVGAMAEAAPADLATQMEAPAAEAVPEEVIVYAPLPQLTGVLTMGNWRQAILDGMYLRQGDSINGFRIVQITADRVLLRDEQREEWVSMTKNETGIEP